MIISLLVRVIFDDAYAEQSIISSAKDPFGLQDDNNVCEKGRITGSDGTIVRRSSSLDKRASDKRHKERSINLKDEQKRTRLLAQKFANEALKSPQLQLNMKKLADLNESRRDHPVKSSPTRGQTGSAFKSPRVSSKKSSKSPKRKGTRKRMRNKRRHEQEKHKKHRPRLRKGNPVKVGKIHSSITNLQDNCK